MATAATNTSFTLAASYFSGKFDPTVVVNGVQIGTVSVLPSIPQLAMQFGVTAGNFNLMSKLYTGTANGKVLWDCTALIDPNGNAVNMARVKAIGVVNFATTDLFDLQIGGAVVIDPTTAPSAAAASGGSLAANTYLTSYSFTNASGETTRSADSSTVVGASGKINITGLPYPFPTTPNSLGYGATAMNVYCSTAGGNRATETVQGSVTASTYSISSVAGGASPVTTNTAALTPLTGISNGSATAQQTLSAGFLNAANILFPNSRIIAAPNTTGMPTSGKNIFMIDSGVNSVPYWVFFLGCDS